jgi:hypothetical protein
MDWGEGLARVLDTGYALSLPAWFVSASALVSLALLLTLVILFAQHLRLRRRFTDRGVDPKAMLPPGRSESPLPRASLHGEQQALIDRWLPRSPRNFLLAVTALAIACWALGLGLATDARVFLASREWQSQPFYLAAHFITLRLFATAFTRTFLAGISHLDIADAAARHRMRLVLGVPGVLIAAAVAAPFSLYDYRYLTEGGGSEGAGPAADRLLFAMWCAEWLLMGFIWVMVTGYMLLSHWAIAGHRFRAAIEVVLHDRQYRPFLQMSVRGASIVLGFWIINIAYVWYSGGELSDYTGAAITLVMVVVGFLPPLLELRGKVTRAVSLEMASLRSRLDSLLMHAAPTGSDAVPPTARALEERIDEVLVMLRISYLERLYAQLGQSEATDIVVKLLVPLTTMAWYGYKYYKALP